MSDYDVQVRDYLDYCRRAWKQLRGRVDRQYHPTGAGACRLIWHNGDPSEAAKIRSAFKTITEEKGA